MLISAVYKQIERRIGQKDSHFWAEEKGFFRTSLKVNKNILYADLYLPDIRIGIRLTITVVRNATTDPIMCANASRNPIQYSPKL